LTQNDASAAIQLDSEITETFENVAVKLPLKLGAWSVGARARGLVDDRTHDWSLDALAAGSRLELRLGTIRLTLCAYTTPVDQY
jgi:hypothetical protein